MGNCFSKKTIRKQVKRLEDFGYRFNDNGELRTIDTDQPFQFEVKKGDDDYNQAHYEALGDAINEKIYSMLETQCDLKRIEIPVDAAPKEPKSFFFASPDAWVNEHMIILIHGSGPVRAGLWARKLTINENLKSGSQIPYVERALDAGYGLVILNTNQNKVSNESDVYIRGSEDPDAHAQYVWDNFIVKSKAQRIAIVAFSAGGVVATNLALRRPKEFMNRVCAIALLDSVHFARQVDTRAWDHLRQHGRHWVTSNRPLDSDVQQYQNEINKCSGGTTAHDRVPYSVLVPVFNFIKTKFM